MSVLDKLRTRWGVGPWSVAAILLAFSLAGLTVVRLREPVLGFLLPADAPTWMRWTVYLVILVPMYQLLLLTYGSLLGQFDFFWSRLRAIGRLLGSRTAGVQN